MRTFICCLSLLAWSCLGHVYAQKNIEERMPINNATSIELDFQYANATISSWDGEDIQITGSVNINNNEENEKFDLALRTENDQIFIQSKVKDFPKKYTNWKGCNKDSCRGESHSCCSLTKVNLVIKIPKGVALDIHAKYGDLNLDLSELKSLQVENIYGAVTASIKFNSIKEEIKLASKYSFVDVSLPRNVKADVELRSSYGEIFTNLDLKVPLKNQLKKVRATVIHARLNGGGQKLLVQASYDNIYLRALE